mgnify:CR=1 FL=1
MIYDSRKKGQALIEVLVGLSVAGILISAATVAIVAILRKTDAASAEAALAAVGGSVRQAIGEGKK